MTPCAFFIGYAGGGPDKAPCAVCGGSWAEHYGEAPLVKKAPAKKAKR